MTRPPPTSRSRAARDVLAAAILEAFETPASARVLDDLHAALADDGVVTDRERAARLAPLASLVRVEESGALLPAHGVESEPLAERVRCARHALAVHRVGPRALPGALGIAAALLAAGLFFEMHEVLEQEWRARSGARRRFYQGLIQLSVALHHLVHRNAGSATRLFAAARAKLAPLGPSFEGVDVATLLDGSEAWERWAHGRKGWPDALALPVLRSVPPL